MVGLIWATRGRSWGFRLLLAGGHSKPLRVYEEAFLGAENDRTLCRRRATILALRFPDPLQRTDAAGRVIPHDFVVSGPMADAIDSVREGEHQIWPLVAKTYAEFWDAATPPLFSTIHAAIAADAAERMSDS